MKLVVLSLHCRWWWWIRRISCIFSLRRDRRRRARSSSHNSTKQRHCVSSRQTSATCSRAPTRTNRGVSYVEAVLSSLKHPSPPMEISLLKQKQSICLKISIFWVYSLGLEMYKRFEFKVRAHGSEFNIMMWTCWQYLCSLFSWRQLLSSLSHIADLCVILYDICDAIN